jgi:prepilin signal peptidase PulO-like enzyme (type II secretory pathway)
MGGRGGQRRDARDPRRARPLRRLTLDLGPFALAAAGAAWGFAADRLSARWPEHETEDRRAVDWRTGVVVIFGLLAGWALAQRWSEPRDLAVVGAYVAALVLLLATDLDQRILPDVVTLPMIPAALALLIAGWDPLLSDKPLGLASGLAAGIGFPLVLAAGSALVRGGLGFGDVKLLVSVGLFSGLTALFRGLLLASVGFGVVLLVLLGLRRVALRSYVPFGPVIIVAAALAALAP